MQTGGKSGVQSQFFFKNQFWKGKNDENVGWASCFKIPTSLLFSGSYPTNHSCCSWWTDDGLKSITNLNPQTVNQITLLT